MFTKLSEHFEFRHFRPHYLDVDTIFGDLRRECLHQRVVRNTIFRKAPPSVVSGYGKRSLWKRLLLPLKSIYFSAKLI